MGGWRPSFQFCLGEKATPEHAWEDSLGVHSVHNQESGDPLQLLTKGRPQESSEGESVNSEDFFFFKEKNLCCRTPVSPLLLTSSLIHSFICSTIQQYLLGASYEPGTGGESPTLLDFTVWGRGDRDESAT